MWQRLISLRNRTPYLGKISLVKIYSSVTSEILPWLIKNIPIKKSASDFLAKNNSTKE